MTTPTIARLHRTTQAHCNQLCEKQTLDHGIAYYCPGFPEAGQLSHFREVVAPDERTCETAFAQAQAWFDGQAIACCRSATAFNQPERAWTSFLATRGFTARRFAAMTLAGWTNPRIDPAVRVLPARAMRGALRETVVFADEPAARCAQALDADILNERLDDASFDLFVAVINGQSAGRCALFQVGDIARVMELFVLPACANSGAAEALLATVLSLAKRLKMASVCAAVDTADPKRQALLKRFGFAEDGVFWEMERAATHPSDGTMS